MMRDRALTQRDITLGQEQSGVKGVHVWEVEKKNSEMWGWGGGGSGGGGWGERRKREEEEETKMGCTKHGLMRTR